MIFLGTGTSQGIPVVGCECEVCQSADAKDKRLRSSVIFIKDGYHLLIDVTPDMRAQLLTHQIDRVHSICITHEHNDHVNGIDDLRPINFKWKKNIPIYALDRVVESIKSRFHYAFADDYAARPRLSMHPIEVNDKFNLGPFEVEAVHVDHGTMDILGYIVDNVAYMTDIKSLSAETIEKVKDCEVVVISALHKRPHSSHQSLEEALQLTERISSPRILITHLSHQMGLHAIEDAELPNQVAFAYDGLCLDL